MDLHAWFEAYVGGRWFTFDATQNEPQGQPRLGRLRPRRRRRRPGHPVRSVGDADHGGPRAADAGADLHRWRRLVGGLASTPMNSRASTSPPRRSGRPCWPLRSRRTCASCSPTILAGPSATCVDVGDLRIDYSKQRVDDDVLAALLAVADVAGVAARRDAMFAGEQINVTEHRAVLHVALRAPAGTVDRASTATTSCPRSTRSCGADGRLRRAGARRHVDGRDRPAHQHRRQHRHRRHPTSARRWRTRRSPPSATPSSRARFVSNVDGADIAGALDGLEPARDAVHRVVEDVRHDRDAHQRPHGPRLARRRPRRRRRAAPLRRREHERRAGRGVRHRHRQHVRLLGVGRRALLGRLGHRAVADGRHRRRAVRRVPRRLPRRRRALPHRAPRHQRAGRAGR